MKKAARVQPTQITRNQFRGPAASRTRATNVIAIDLGAESCRVTLATRIEDRTTLQTIHRFPNAPIQVEQHLYWDLASIRKGVLTGISKCTQLAGGPIDAIGVDGWAVDYVRLNREMQPLADPFCYRDTRTESRQLELWKKIPRDRIYKLTGIQHLRFNTLYQLYADRCDHLSSGHGWLTLPEYLLSFLGGAPVAEYSNATHTQMVTVGTQEWSEEVFNAAGLDRKIAPKIVPTGTPLGTFFCPELEDERLKQTLLIAPACHDTGSAIAGIPAQGDDWAFISSGTWSLIGTILPRACTSEAAMNFNFSNEGGIGGKSRFLKNVNGMWLLQECQRHWEKSGAGWETSALVKACDKLAAPGELLDVDDPSLLLQGNMPERINTVLKKNGLHTLPAEAADAPRVANLIFHSLAARYAALLQQISTVTGKSLKKIYIVGGGSKNQYLNGLIAASTGLEVCRGAVESSTIGNIAVQFAVIDGDRSSGAGVTPEAVALWSRKLCSSAAVRNESK
jgi:rhamnulokinase